MTEEELERRKEAERFRSRSRQYQKGLSYYEDFDPSIIPGGRHYFSRYTDGAQEHERVCSDCNAWKFSIETDGRKYNTELKWCLQLSSVRVCVPPHKISTISTQPTTNACANMQARVANRMDMTDGLDKDILETIDQVRTTHNPYSQQIMNARNLLIESAGPEYQAAVEEFARRDRAGEARPEDNPELRLHEFLPEDENFKLRLHVARNSNPGTNNNPTSSEVAGIIIDRGAAEHKDIILHSW
ncbi:Helitron helicase [Phytophthora megakarya]|uniref:Helitron helicase n=1 Tax=Phytophthora megakarya TaxID=4795 RepID=A0A225VA47_9STRA|nr:Helitron helicase [Phytophthora megakarya]